jgi:hypothetical protein
MGKDATHHRRRYNQPLAGVMANAGACLRWLDRENPDLDAVRRPVEWVVDDGDRASEVIRRIRGARDAIYLRVSTDTQTTANQRREPEDVAARSGWQIVEVYEIAGISGAKGRDKRLGLDALLKAVNAKNPTSSRLGPLIASGAPSQICCRHFTTRVWISSYISKDSIRRLPPARRCASCSESSPSSSAVSSVNA